MKTIAVLGLTMLFASCTAIMEKKEPSLSQPVREEPASGATSEEEEMNGAAMPADGLPTAVAKAREVLAEALRVPADTIVVLHEEKREWPDSCLGIPQPEMACTQTVVRGYRVVLRTAQGYEYVFRTDRKGDLMLTEPASPAEERLQGRVRGEVTALDLETADDGSGNISLLRVILVEGEKSDDTDYANARVTVPPASVIYREGEEVAVEELATGQTVEVTFTALPDEADPVEGTAASIVILSGY